MDDGSSAAHLDYDHRESKNVRFFAVRSGGVQNFRRCPSYRLIVKEGPLESWVLGHSGKAKIRDPRSAGVHDNVRLYACQIGRNANTLCERSHTPFILP